MIRYNTSSQCNSSVCMRVLFATTRYQSHLLHLIPFVAIGKSTNFRTRLSQNGYGSLDYDVFFNGFGFHTGETNMRMKNWCTYKNKRNKNLAKQKLAKQTQANNNQANQHKTDETKLYREEAEEGGGEGRSGEEGGATARKENG